MRRLLAAIVTVFSRVPHAILGLIGRLSIGLVFWNSGRTKVDGWNIFTVNDKTRFLCAEE